MGAVTLWAGVLLRRHWRATVLLGMLCGLTAGAVGAAWATARATSRAFPDFVANAGSSAVFVACGPGEPVTQSCAQQFEPRVVRDTVASVAGIQAAARTSPVVGQLRKPGGQPEFQLMVLYADPPGLLENGSGLLLAGDRTVPKQPGDIVVNESAARASGLTVGQHLTFTPYLADQIEANGGTGTAHGPPVRGRVVGIVRQPIDLASNSAKGSADFGLLSMVVPPAWWAAEPAVYRYGVGVAATIEPGADPARTKAAVVAKLRPRLAQFENESSADVSTVFDAINYEVWAARAFAIVIALFGLLLLGQALGRQVGRESRDAGQLRALGFTRVQLAQASGLRWAVTGIVAAVTGAVTMFAASPIAPIGLARKTIDEPNFGLDSAIGGLIAITTVVTIALAGAWSAWRVHSRRSGRAPSTSVAIHSVRPTATTGVTATLRSLRRPLRTNAATALGAIVLVATAAIASAAVVQSYDRLLNRPPQFGAPWDAVVGNNANAEEAQQVANRLSRIDGIDGAAGIIDLDGQHVGREPIPLVAFIPAGDLPKTIGPQIAEGRAPTEPGEIALGAVTMRHLGLRIGDKVRIEVPNTKLGHLQVRVVGRALLNNTYALEPGAGGVLPGAWASELIRGEGDEPSPQQIAVRVADNADRARVLGDLQHAFPETFSRPVPSTGLRNLGRIRSLPWTLVGMLAVLGAGVALQALLASIRRRRHELAVLRAIGFTAPNARASLRWQVATLSLIAAVLSIPLGLIVGRLGWKLITRANGLAMSAFVPVGIVALIATLAFVLPVALMAFPAWLEVRRNAGEILRTE